MLQVAPKLYYRNIIFNTVVFQLNKEAYFMEIYNQTNPNTPNNIYRQNLKEIWKKQNNIKANVTFDPPCMYDFIF